MLFAFKINISKHFTDNGILVKYYCSFASQHSGQFAQREVPQKSNKFIFTMFEK